MAIEKDLGAVSAYAIAVENGFEGTVEEWLESLRYDHSDEFGILAGQVQEDAESAAVSAQVAELSEQSAAQSANAAKQSAEQSAQAAADAGQIVKDAETAAIAAINEVEATAVSSVSLSGQSQVDAVNTAGTSAVSDIGAAKTDALTGIDTAKTDAVGAVNTAGTQAASDAQTAITAAKNQAVSDVQSAGQSAVSAVGDAQTTAVEAVEDAQTNAVQAVQNAGTAEIEKINDILPVPTAEDAGKVPIAKPDGSGYELGSQIDDAQTAETTTWSSENIVSQICPPFTTEGSIVTCQPVEGSRLNAVVQIEPIQEGEGDPSPENVRPIKGFDTVNVWRGGKNLFGGTELINSIKNADASAVIDETEKTITFTGSTVNGKTIFNKFLPNRQYSILFFGKNTNASSVRSNMRLEYTDGSGISLDFTTAGENSWAVFVSDSSKSILRIHGTQNTQSTVLYYEQFEIVEGTINTDNIPPYRGEIFTLSLGQTVYGGTLDVGSGTLTITHAEYVEDGNRNFDMSYWPTLLFPPVPKGLEGIKESGVISNMFSNVGWGNERATNIQIRNVDTVLSGLSTNEEFKSYFKGMYDAGNPATFVYELANPVTLQLTPQEIRALSGVNTVYADAGDVTVSGYSDPTTIIKNLADRIAALEHNAIGG